GEIYVRAFEGIIKKCEAWRVMCWYNLLNGRYRREKEDLVDEILREEWGYEGVVVWDWRGVNDGIGGLKGGVDV
ncbi:hypothetical protein, partial [Paenibacillus xylanexedens]|uniref:hypothetical protein n=1 Tax=Paenibacillus xylanexedens TaxID=528191 RepID=UPI0011AA9DBC